MSPAPISDLIAEFGSDLTPTERRIAEAVIADPTLIAFGTVSDLANRVGTSRPSVVRFAGKLGFDGYTEMQERARQGLSQRLFRPTERIRSEYTASATRLTMERALASVFETVDAERLAAMASPIAEADRVWIVTGETSRAAATVLASGLTMIRPEVRLVSDHGMGQELSSAAEDDAGVVFDFYRYRRTSLVGAEILRRAGATLVAVTDGPLSPLAGLCDIWCEIDVPAIGAFDSSVPAVAVAELLVAEVTDMLHDEAASHLVKVEESWAVAGTFLDV
jgi:DNA-binding MurR/RpiR family transcriptional regulator